MATIYSYSAVEELLKRYSESGREYVGYTIPGSLLDGMIITGDKLKTAIIKEVYLNEYSSGATIRLYNKIPAKYARVIEMIEEAEDGDEKAQERIYRAFYAA